MKLSGNEGTEHSHMLDDLTLQESALLSLSCIYNMPLSCQNINNKENYHMNTVDLGSLIRLKRKEKGLNQKNLADLLHVSAAAVNKWENGKNSPDCLEVNSG